MRWSPFRSRRPAGLLAAAALAAALPAAVPGPASASVDPATGCSTATLVAVNTADNNLYRWTRPTPTSGSWSASTKVGSNWSSIRLTAVDEGTGDLFAVDYSGYLHRYWWNGSVYTGGTTISHGWDSTTQLVPAGNGVLYAVRTDGTLAWYHWSDGAWDTMTSGGAKANGQVVGTGWNGFSLVFSGGAGILYGIRKSDGALLWYHQKYPGMGVASWEGPKVIGSGWGSMRSVVGFGRGAIEAVTSSGLLVSYVHTGYFTGAATWENNGVGQTVGQGWGGWSRISGNPTACSPAIAGRSDNTTSPVYFVHGLGGRSSIPKGNGGWDCVDYWGYAEQRFQARGWSGPLRTVQYYGLDTSCDGEIYGGGDMDTPIEDVGKALAWWVYRHNTLFGQSVDLIGHSLGGLIIRDAITGVEQNRAGYPPVIYVEDAITLDSPHQGTTLAQYCPSVRVHQCVEIQPDSDFLGSLGWNPQVGFGTDWTTIGVADDDRVVPATSTIGLSSGRGAMQPGHQVLYTAGQFGDMDLLTGAVHMRVLTANGTSYTAWHHDYHGQSLGLGDGSISVFQGVSGFTWLGGAPSPVDWAYEAASHSALW